MRSRPGPVLVVAFAVGCGSHSSPASFRQKADAICARATARTASIDARTTRDPLGPSTQVRRAVAIQRRAVAELRALKPPREQEAAFASLLATYERLVHDGEQVARWETLHRREALDALARAPEPRHLTPAELAHPTAAIIDRAMRLPAFRRYVFGLERIAGRSLRDTRRAARLARQLGLDRCAG